MPSTNTGSFALRKLRRDLQGKGINWRRTVDITGAAASTPITVPGLGTFDELVSVLLTSGAAFPSVFTELLTLSPAVAVQATLTDTGAVSKLKYTAQSAYPGTKGNAITVQYVTAGNNTPLSVVVSGTAIVVNLATGPAGAVTSIVNDVLNALKINSLAMALVDVDLSAGTGTDLAVAMASSPLVGGVDANTPNVVIVETGAVQALLVDTGAVSKLKYFAQSAYPGTKGNAITVQYVIGAGNNALSIVVTGTAIVVNSATAAGVATSVVNDVLAALKGNSLAMALVDVDLSAGTGTDLVATMAATNLAGGLDPAVAIKTPTVTNTTATDRLMVEFLSRLP
jgi:ActR/RegA family two-component response regulator